METKIRISTIFDCSLERAFLTPMLCDITKVHTGYGFIPRVTHCLEDENWGQEGSSKKVYVEKSLTYAGGFGFIDNIVERVENKYWKIEVNNFQTNTMGFYRFVGEWETTQLEENKILIDYTYTLYSNIIVLYPFNFIFTKIIWRRYMKQILENVRKLVNDKSPYLFA
ncbi:MAG: hypothetical protein EBV82_09385 [Chitinophagia bacterium]|nr:hypothetical protein [Chitinophagia bacterium]